MEQSSSNSALISLMGVPATERVKTFTPCPDLDGFQGVSGEINKGAVDSSADINSSFIGYENTRFVVDAVIIFDVFNHEFTPAGLFSFCTKCHFEISFIIEIGALGTMAVIF